tara:strand:- start:1826 stop:2743 length:918 start_codon:yes stop_codon:yes gene_type:complete
MNKCKICSDEFDSEKKMHMHLRSHKITLAEYYTKYYPRENFHTGEPLPFKNKEQYFDRDFSNRKQLLEWCKNNSDNVVKEYILELLKRRITRKNLKFGPSHLELKTSELPTIELYQKHFGSYSKACDLAGVKPLFSSRLPNEWDNEVGSDVKIFIDTREQQPLKFSNSEPMKLDFGDYAVGKDHYDYTYVDRKSETDFKSTLSKNNLNRFRAELQRTKDFDSYLFIVTETDMSTMEKRNKWSPHTSNMKYIYHNMRVLAHDFAGSCQFIFTGSREQSQNLIPKILTLGKKLWDIDLQYYISNKLI